MKQLLVIALSCLLTVGRAHAQNAQAAFSDGLADRQSYEEWFNSLGGDYQTGALFWVGLRSRNPNGSCYGGPSEAWVKGCQEAKQRLNPTDRRRLANADYRSGWNSYAPKPLVDRPPVTDQAQTPAVAVATPGDLSICLPIRSNLQRLDCYDSAVRGDMPKTAQITPPLESRPQRATPDRSGFGVSDIDRIVDDSRHNEARFARDYKEKQFTGKMSFDQSSAGVLT